MITNERQYRITRKKAHDLARAIEEFDINSDSWIDVHPRLLQTEREGMESQLKELREEMEEYERLKSAEISVISVGSFEELADGLIKARIAGGLSQRALARRLNPSWHFSQLVRLGRGGFRRVNHYIGCGMPL